jgi:hypothetical protein
METLRLCFATGSQIGDKILLTGPDLGSVHVLIIGRTGSQTSWVLFNGRFT